LKLSQFFDYENLLKPNFPNSRNLTPLTLLYVLLGLALA
jgi:hypothetical protein